MTHQADHAVPNAHLVTTDTESTTNRTKQALDILDAVANNTQSSSTERWNREELHLRTRES